MSIAANKTLVLEFLSKINDRDLQHLSDNFHDEGVHWLAGNPATFPIAGEHDKPTFLQIMQDSWAISEVHADFLVMSNPADAAKVDPNRIQYIMQRVTAEDNRVCVEASVDLPTESGGLYNQRYHYLFEITDGKISLFKEYYDTELVVETFKNIF